MFDSKTGLRHLCLSEGRRSILGAHRVGRRVGKAFLGARAAQARPGQVWLRFLTLAAGALAAPSQAHAGAWMNKDQMIASLVGGQEQDAPVEGDLYWERQAGDRIGVVTRGYFVSQPDYAASFGQNAGQVSVSGKYSLYQGDAGAAAMEFGANYSSEADPSCSGWGGQLRALAGKGFGAGFVAVEAGYVAQRADCVHGKLDLTAGFRPGDGWLTMAQVFLDRRYDVGHVAKAQISVVRLFSTRTGVQVGLRQRIDRGQEGGPALLLGLWRAAG